MYKLSKNTSIIRIADGATISPDVGNTDYQAYLAWVAAGNTPAPVDPETAQETALRVAREAELVAAADAKADAVVQYLATHTPLECYQYVQSNVTNLAEAKVMMGKFAAILSVMARRL
jgi:hypothetical protein